MVIQKNGCLDFRVLWKWKITLFKIISYILENKVVNVTMQLNFDGKMRIKCYLLYKKSRQYSNRLIYST
jgi:hypothetical protein